MNHRGRRMPGTEKLGQYRAHQVPELWLAFRATHNEDALVAVGVRHPTV
jgi:hypothetical protein